MTIDFYPKNIKRIRGVRAADKGTNRTSFSGLLPWFDLDNLMGPAGNAASSFEGIIEFESLLEHDFLVLSRSDGMTWKVKPQPRKIEWWDSRTSQWRIHYPDFEVMRRDCRHPIYIQVKPMAQVKKRIRELKLIKASCRDQGLAFEVWSERKIRRQPRFANASMLFGQSGPMEDADALDRVRKALHAASPAVLTLGQVRRAAGTEGDTIQAVLRLHVLKEVELDLARPIDAKAPVRLATRA